MSVARVVVEPDAKQDIRNARDYYSEKSEALSADFKDELIKTFDLFSRHPEAVAVAFGSTRLKPMRRFPYVIGYVYRNGVVHVTGVRFGGLGLDAFGNRDS